MQGTNLISLLITLTCTITAFAELPTIADRGHFKKVVFIIFENENLSAVMKQKDFAHYVTVGANLTNMFGETHPSQGNYIALVAGSTMGVKSDSDVNLDGNHIGDLLEKANMDWRVYAEDYPGNCFTETTKGEYVRKHVPFMSFKNVSTNPARCAKIENDSRFFTDLNSGSLPEYSLFIPNMKNDGHDTGSDYAGKWLTSKFGQILDHPDQYSDVLFVLTWDESEILSLKNQIYTVLIGKNIQPGSKSAQRLNHISLLKMVEDQLGLGNLGREDATAPAITGIWK